MPAVTTTEETGTPLKDVNAAVVYADTDLGRIEADVYIIAEPVAVLNNAALKMLQRQFGAKRADEYAISEALSSMTEEDIERQLMNVSSLIMSNSELISAINKAESGTQKTAEEIRKLHPDAVIVICNMYNPLAGLNSASRLGYAAKILQGYVDKLNSELENTAESYDASVADISDIRVSVDISTDKDGRSVSDELFKMLSLQKAEMNKKINNIHVDAEPSEMIYGDLNRDGSVNAADLVVMKNYHLSKGSAYSETDMMSVYNFAAGDLDKDGKICSIADIAILKLYLIDPEGKFVPGLIKI